MCADFCAHIGAWLQSGERTPVRKRLVHLGIPSRFLLCGSGREFAAGVINDTPDGAKNESELMLMRRRLELPGEGNTVISGGDTECYFGELTNQGRRSTLRLGSKLRELYVDKLVNSFASPSNCILTLAMLQQAEVSTGDLDL